MLYSPFGVRISVSGATQRLLDLITPRFFWFDFRLAASLYRRYGVPVSI
jgi:hypothetical protein